MVKRWTSVRTDPNVVVVEKVQSGGEYTMTNLPGGTAGNPLAGAVYGVEAIGWSSMNSTKAVAVPGIADLRRGNASVVDMTMMSFREASRSGVLIEFS